IAAYTRGAGPSRAHGAPLLEPVLRIQRAGSLAHLEVQHGALERRTGVADTTDRLTGLHLLAVRDQDVREVSVERVEAITVVDHHDLPEAAEVVAGEVDAALAHHPHRRSGGRLDVDPVVARDGAETRVRFQPEIPHDLAPDGPVQRAASLGELAG